MVHSIPASGVTSGSFQIPQDLSNTASTFYRITLTVVDSQGLQTVVTQDIHPSTTSWSVNTNVAGAPYFVDGTWHTTPYSTSDGVGIQHVLSGVPTVKVGWHSVSFQWLERWQRVDGFVYH